MIQVSISPPTLPPTVGQQFFVIGSGIAAGVAGLILAKQLVGVEKVPTSAVILATGLSALALLGAGVYIAKKAKEAYYGL
jgi:hypothetical protein